MSLPHVAIAVESDDAVEVQEVFDAIIDSRWPFQLEVVDVRAEMAFAANFLRRRGLTEESQIWREFDSRQFGVSILLTTVKDSLADELKEIVADRAAQRLSKSLNTRVAVLVEDGDKELVIYESGHLLRQWKAGETYFRGRRWRPSRSK